ncbi:hypothetical protein BC938DRAFT_472013 [Jimgerdemannia flammicorona]|uniref:Uncharacterized protein n=1 Tax=Jimgerdemannia flammicorona TaxID=994334 RepID=A0A433QU97_9FUNG|nr:hypothetical protein BC938DRAFT_472013 [Jimgerdemannia flammicorona]
MLSKFTLIPLCILLAATCTYAVPSARLAHDRRAAPQIESNKTLVPASELSPLEDYAKLAAVAYCKLDTWICGSLCNTLQQTTLVMSFSMPGARATGYIARNDVTQSIYVAFRGTFYMANFLQDANLILVPYPSVEGALVRKGCHEYLIHGSPVLVTFCLFRSFACKTNAGPSLSIFLQVFTKPSSALPIKSTRALINK